MKRYKIKRRDYPETCPKCESEDIIHWGTELGVDYFLEDAVECQDCDFTWVMRFKYQKWYPTDKYAE